MERTLSVYLTRSAPTMNSANPQPESKMPTGGPRLAILLNMIAPYRVPILSEIGTRFATSIFVSTAEGNRVSWQTAAESLGHIQIRRTRGIMLTMRQHDRDGTFDLKYLHLHPGYIVDLFRLAPDAVISLELGFRTFCAVVYCTLSRTPLWVWWGGTAFTERNIGWGRRCLRWLLLRHVDRWISYGQAATQYLTTLGVPRDTICQIQNCVDQRLFVAKAAPAFQLAPRPVLLGVGQMIGRKGWPQLLQSASRLQQRGEEFTLLLVGGGPEQPRCEALAAQLGLRHVHFFPTVSPENMPAVYWSADCLVFPTLEDVWGLVVNEAIWCGLPVISSIYAGCTCEIVSKENQFDPLDPVDFDRALLRAVRGEAVKVKVKPSSLRTCSDLADLIVTDIQRELARRGRATGT